MGGAPNDDREGSPSRAAALIAERLARHRGLSPSAQQADRRPGSLASSDGAQITPGTVVTFELHLSRLDLIHPLPDPSHCSCGQVGNVANPLQPWTIAAGRLGVVLRELLG